MRRAARYGPVSTTSIFALPVGERPELLLEIAVDVPGVPVERLVLVGDEPVGGLARLDQLRGREALSNTEVISPLASKADADELVLEMRLSRPRGVDFGLAPRRNECGRGPAERRQVGDRRGKRGRRHRRRRASAAAWASPPLASAAPSARPRDAHQRIARHGR